MVAIFKCFLPLWLVGLHSYSILSGLFFLLPAQILFMSTHKHRMKAGKSSPFRLFLLPLILVHCKAWWLLNNVDDTDFDQESCFYGILL